MRKVSRATIPYRDALRAQEQLVAKRQRGEIGDVLWLLEHPLTITLGSAGGEAHLRASAEAIVARGGQLVPTRRGGDVTCHEPGQLVGYPIVDLGDRDDERDLHLFIRRLEQALIDVLAGRGLRGGRVDGRTGVWLLDDRPARKIAAIGVRCQRWVTSHGFALNAENDLAGFRLVVPCGISDAGVTRLADEVAAERRGSWDEVCLGVHRALEQCLGRELRLLCGEEGLALAGE